MEGLALATSSSSSTTATAFFVNRFRFSSHLLVRRRTRKISFTGNRNRFVVFASKEEPKLDQWDQMELKFGQMLGEDPKLTIAKIMARKANPDASYLEIEKSFNKKKGKLKNIQVEEVPFDGSKRGQSSSSLDGLNLVRPVPKKGIKFNANEKPTTPEMKKPSQSVGKAVENTKGSVPNVILRKPSMFYEEDVEEKPSRLRFKPNLSLRMGNEQPKEKFSDMTLLRKPEPMSTNKNLDKEEEPSGDVVVDDVELEMGKEVKEEVSDVTLLKRPEVMNVMSKVDNKPEEFGDAETKGVDDIEGSSSKGIPKSAGTNSEAKNNFEEYFETAEPKLEGDSIIGLQPLEQSDMGSADEEADVRELSDTTMLDSSIQFSLGAALQGKPARLDQSVKETSNSSRAETVSVNSKSYLNGVEPENSLATLPLKEREEADWTRVEDLVRTGGRPEVELISSSTRGFVVSFGSLIGFLPYRNLSARWKFLAFESWLRRKGLDPSMYRQNLGLIGTSDVKNSSLDSSPDPEIVHKIEGEISSDMKLEDLLGIYDIEKAKFLSSFVGQKVKVNVVLADKKSRKLIFSVRPKEKEELVEKKKSLMAKLRVGDIVKCCIKKIAYFGIFVEVEGVPALIHQTEVSWDATLNPVSYFKIGQIMEAKVHQLDFALERIFLSLKEITPDPLLEALESVVGDRNPLDGRLEAAEADAEWSDVESLIKELQQIEGIQTVSKGRFFLSPGLAPTFQVYMASMFENQYKLLARSGNKVQEVIVHASLGKEEMKTAILTCTSRVE